MAYNILTWCTALYSSGFFIHLFLSALLLAICEVWVGSHIIRVCYSIFIRTQHVLSHFYTNRSDCGKGLLVVNEDMAIIAKSEDESRCLAAYL
jgi:hypothetical protein